MKTIRSVVALISTVAVMACQTAEGTASAANAPIPEHASFTSARAAHPAVRSSIGYTQTATAAPAADVVSSKRKTVLLVAIAAVVVVAAVILIGNGSGGSGY